MAVGMGMIGLVEVIVVVGMDMVMLVGMVMGVAVGNTVVGVLMGVGMGMLVAVVVANMIVMDVHSVSPYAFFFYYSGYKAGCQIGIYRTVEQAHERPRLLLEEKLSAKLTDVVLPRSGQKRKFCFADHHIRPR
jgi:hypothetical protein